MFVFVFGVESTVVNDRYGILVFNSEKLLGLVAERMVESIIVT